MSKHDDDCLRRRADAPYLCTCGLTDHEVVNALDGAAPNVGDRYIATDNAGAIAALCGEGYPVPHGVIYVNVEKVYPEQRKVQVRPDGLWLTWTDLYRWFRPVGRLHA